MLELARMYEKGDGIWRDLVLSYSCSMVLMNDYLWQDLRAAELNKPQSIAVTMENIATVEVMARAWKQQSGIY
jgi:hypothetical protein